MNYYNEHDNFAADWLENSIEKGLIPDGKVDRRSIADVQADDVRGFTQCHFFAGIGGWPLALQLAGWDPHRPVWTGSCPCQPFSQAGKQKASNDERHLWPEMYRLIKECMPEIVFGEQVASAEVVGTRLEADFVVAVQAGDFARANTIAKRLVASSNFHFHRRWLDGIQHDLESESYSVRCKVLGAFSVGAPHKRARLYWVADSTGVRGAQHVDDSRKREEGREDHSADCCRVGGLADSDSKRERAARQSDGQATKRSTLDAVVDTSKPGLERRSTSRCANKRSTWSASVAIDCRDGKSRRVESSIQPLVNGIPLELGRGKPELSRMAKRARANRVGRLKGYGNAIVPQVAAEFVMAIMNCSVNK